MLIQNITNNNEDLFYSQDKIDEEKFMKDKVMISLNEDDENIEDSNNNAKLQDDNNDSNVFISMSNNKNFDVKPVSNELNKENEIEYKNKFNNKLMKNKKNLKDLLLSFNKELIKDNLAIQKANKLLNY